MVSILPRINDRWRNLRNGKKRWTGQVLRFDPKPRVIADVYGDTLEEMKGRMSVVCEALKNLEQPK